MDMGTLRMFKRIDDHARAYWYLWLFNRWLAFNLNAISAIFAVLVSAVIVSTKAIDASLAGFALSFALQFSSAMVSADNVSLSRNLLTQN